MDTRDLVTRLAGSPLRAERNAITRRLNRALVLGFVGSAILLVLLYGVRSDMPWLILTAMFWLRLAFPLAIVVTSMSLAARLGRPGARIREAWLAVALPLAAMLCAAAGVLLAAPPGYRLQLMLGTTWHVTTGNIVVLSLPPLAAIMQAMRGLAPTRLRLAGAGAGVLAGAQGTLVYSLYTPEMSVPFWAVWHGLALAITAALGAALARAWLRW
ncbi:DUF1109 domain-containing protein [Paraburkholderia acidisoli]|uniref:DUF1109 family protein n=1 Tax=Paraburkholderia acidisoli TaxID=2571748 RepID=A0A7Z2GRF9_9BURK|nr:DUF1109 domain-containing protein [Paraburkholderia acidisoli]QGZ66601.1 DUF1109 family protein [Paraburkholderia acidisoli]